MARLCELSVVTIDLQTEGADVFRVEAEVLEGVGDCLMGVSVPVAIVSSVGGKRAYDGSGVDRGEPDGH